MLFFLGLFSFLVKIFKILNHFHVLSIFVS
jgi:hypothetical protein